jgi:hypothetical protein
MYIITEYGYYQSFNGLKLTRNCANTFVETRTPLHLVSRTF